MTRGRPFPGSVILRRQQHRSRWGARVVAVLFQVSINVGGECLDEYVREQLRGFLRDIVANIV